MTDTTVKNLQFDILIARCPATTSFENRKNTNINQDDQKQNLVLEEGPFQTFDCLDGRRG